MTLTSDSPASITASRALSLELEQNQASQRIITGAGFGAGPNVVLFDRFAGQDREVLSATRQADVGQWTNKIADSGFDSKLYSDRGRTWFAQRDPDALGTGDIAEAQLFYESPSQLTEFRIACRFWVPADKWLPGASAPATFPPNSTWKLIWFAGSTGADLSGISGNDDQADLAFAIHAGNGRFLHGGNSVQPMSATGQSFDIGFSFTAPTLFSFYQSGVESFENANDQTGDSFWVNDQSAARELLNDTSPFKANADTWATMIKHYLGVRLGGFFGNAGANGNSYEQVMPLAADIYLAVGSSSQACIITGNAATLSSCTEAYIIPPDSWSDSVISYTPADHESLTYTHIIKADGTLVENAGGV